MATVERQIDALGGIAEGSGEYNAGYHDGHSRALNDAMQIGADADALIEELLETIEDILAGNQSLAKWVATTEVLMQRVKRRRAS